MRGMPGRAAPLIARGRSRVVALVCLVASGCVASAACDFGYDVDDLTACPECADASGAASDGPTASDGGDAARCAEDRGGAMVLAAGSCIDRTEVTNAHYETFLASGFRLDAERAGPSCDPAGSYVPAAGWPAPSSESSHPVTHVTWCAARAFCAWAGKRMCGLRNPVGSGGALDVALLGRFESDEWSAACSSDGKFTYPYAHDYSARACNGDDYLVRDTLPAGSIGTCAPTDGGAPRDLSGNVWELIDACEREDDFCYARGGGFNSPASELTCVSRLRVGRNAGLDTVGFRCCAP